MSSLLQSCRHRKSRKISEQSIDICCFCCILSFAAVRRAFERWTCSSNLIAYVVTYGSTHAISLIVVELDDACGAFMPSRWVF